MATSKLDTSFSSPYSINTLDNIPPPVLKILVSLGPLLHWIRQATDIIQWQSSSSRQSILAVLLWNTICLRAWTTLAFGLPLLVLYKLGSDWLRVRTLRTRRDRLERTRLQQLEKQKEQHQDKDHDDDERLVSQRLQQQRENEEEELIARKIRPQGQLSLDETLQDITAINVFVDRMTASSHFILYNYLDGSRPEILVSVLSALLYLIPFWIVLVGLLGSHGTFALIGSVSLLWYSPWARVIVTAIQRHSLLRYGVSNLWAYAVALVTSWKAFDFFGGVSPAQSSSSCFSLLKRWASYVWRRAQSEKRVETLQQDHVGVTDVDDSQWKTTKSEMVFQFEIYENQRWWLGANWTTNMLSSERAAWTDNQLVPITSKESFQLPETVESTMMAGSAKDIKQVIKKTWSWADADWWVDMTGELDGRVDHNGWEYGNNAWHHLSGMPAMQTFTRRRRWCRRARLVEYQQWQQVNDNQLTSPNQNDSVLRKRT